MEGRGRSFPRGRVFRVLACTQITTEQQEMKGGHIMINVPGHTIPLIYGIYMCLELVGPGLI